jgi:RimJ/RimL family protein N-acetyltransferase
MEARGMTTEPSDAVRLRPWQPGDVPALLAAHRDPALRRWLGTRVADEDEARVWIERQAADRAAGVRLAYAVLVDGFDVPVGHVVLKGLAPDSDRAEVGYWTAPAARGRGVVGAALHAILAEATALPRAVPLRRFELMHAQGNEASCRVAQKAGFALGAVLPADPPLFPTGGHLHRLTVGRVG